MTTDYSLGFDTLMQLWHGISLLTSAFSWHGSTADCMTQSTSHRESSVRSGSRWIPLDGFCKSRESVWPGPSYAVSCARQLDPLIDYSVKTSRISECHFALVFQNSTVYPTVKNNEEFCAWRTDLQNHQRFRCTDWCATHQKKKKKSLGQGMDWKSSCGDVVVFNFCKYLTKCDRWMQGSNLPPSTSFSSSSSSPLIFCFGALKINLMCIQIQINAFKIMGDGEWWTTVRGGKSIL